MPGEGKGREGKGREGKGRVWINQEVGDAAPFSFRLEYERATGRYKRIRAAMRYQNKTSKKYGSQQGRHGEFSRSIRPHDAAEEEPFADEQRLGEADGPCDPAPLQCGSWS